MGYQISLAVVVSFGYLYDFGNATNVFTNAMYETYAYNWESVPMLTEYILED